MTNELSKEQMLCESCGYFTPCEAYSSDRISQWLCSVCASTFLSQVSSSDVDRKLASSIGWLANALVDTLGVREQFEAVTQEQIRLDEELEYEEPYDA